MSSATRRLILDQINRLDAKQERQLLDFMRHLALPLPAREGDQNLNRFSGCIEAADAKAMTEAIQAGCETIDPNAW